MARRPKASKKHGWVEGDGSLTCSDVFIGNNRNFNQTLFDMELQLLEKFGDDGPDGAGTVFNLQTLIEIKRQNFESDQALDPARRINGAYRTTKLAAKRIITSFLMNQGFPENWFRAAAPVAASHIPAQIVAALPDWVPGHNDKNHQEKPKLLCGL
ncbi:hypothetical protein C8J57DRAFT_1255544 [Mycena rebaudengoi]|nr:hypothetical protein C8J57DRAFT_1255544 [Mycena rebaudengoi]